MSEISAIKLNLNVFSLARTKKDCYYPPVNVDYTPIKTSNQTVQQILPKFNLDEQFFTPAFINPYQLALLRENPQEVIHKQREKFLKKVALNDHSATNENPFFNPEDNSYCSLCKTTFECYWAHINGAIHIKRIKGNKFNTYINDLCRKFKGVGGQKQNQLQNNIELRKRKKISKRSRKMGYKKQKEAFTREDFIVKLPSDLFSKQAHNINYNVSTNGFNSLDNLLKQ